MKKMYEEGGLATDGMNVDPVSGNDIPVGSNAEDVRDDVDAKLSSGEYIVPADVVKYIGVAQLEKLVDKAKVGLEDMEANGRIGGAPVADPEEVVMTLGGDLNTLDGYATGGMVPGADIDGIINRVKAAAEADPSIINMLKSKGIFIRAPEIGKPSAPAAAPAAVATQQKTPGFAEGGVATPNFTSNFNPYAYTPGFSANPAATGSPVANPYAPTPVATNTPTCPPGQVFDPAQNMCVLIQNPLSNSNVDVGEDPNEGSQNSTTGSQDINSGSWTNSYDYTNTESLMDSVMTTIGTGEETNKGVLGGVVGLASSVLSNTPIGRIGSVIGKFGAMNNVAKARAFSIVMRENGDKKAADKIDSQLADYIETNKLKDTGLMSGERYAKTLRENGDISRFNGGNVAGLSTAKDMVSQPAAVQQSYQDYADLGNDRDNSWEGGQVASNQDAPSNDVSPGDRAQDAADRGGYGMATGGRNTGGLVDRRVKLKPTTSKNKKPTKKTTKKTTKKGLGYK